MNKLIIIGNGFDLAHGLKTGYQDFVLSYFKNIFKKCYKGEEYNDQLVRVKNHKRFKSDSQFDNFLNNITSITHIYSSSFITFEESRSKESLFYIKFKSEFFKKFIYKYNTDRWVDIEAEYYENLKAIALDEKDADSKIKVEKLNKELDYIGLKLKEYISEIEEGFVYKDVKKSNRKFVKKITKILSEAAEDSVFGNKVKLLNFNYTRTIDGYLSDANFLKTNRINSVNIHGCVDDDKVIFGYGNDLDRYYPDLEDLKINELLRNIKSFHYQLSDDYKKLVDFLDADKFEVYIIGHSCGLSDRTMLTTIFDNNLCKNIRIFHYGVSGDDRRKDFFHKCIEISRHFNDKIAMRDKLLPFNPQDVIPQIDEE